MHIDVKCPTYARPPPLWGLTLIGALFMWIIAIDIFESQAQKQGIRKRLYIETYIDEYTENTYGCI